MKYLILLLIFVSSPSQAFNNGKIGTKEFILSYSNGPNNACTITMLHTNWGITAAHCVVEAKVEGKRESTVIRKVRKYNGGDNIGTAGIIQEIYVHPEYYKYIKKTAEMYAKAKEVKLDPFEKDELSNNQFLAIGFDIAVLRLKGFLATRTNWPKIITNPNTLNERDELNLAGYGYEAENWKQEQNVYNKDGKVREVLPAQFKGFGPTIARTGTINLTCKPAFVWEPTLEDLFKLWGGIKPYQLSKDIIVHEITNSVDKSKSDKTVIFDGDSGGPVYVSTDKGIILTSVISSTGTHFPEQLKLKIKHDGKEEIIDIESNEFLYNDWGEKYRADTSFRVINKALQEKGLKSEDVEITRIYSHRVENYYANLLHPITQNWLKGFLPQQFFQNAQQKK